MAEFNRNLYEMRVQRGFSQKAMSEAIGVAQSTYSLYEKGAREPNIAKIIKIAEVLRITVDELFDFKCDGFLKLYNSLDDIDRAEINGTVKQMLKSDKYKK